MTAWGLHGQGGYAMPFSHSPWCADAPQVAENLGEVLRGDRIENSLYQINMRVDEQCKILCRIDSLSAPQAKAFQTKIQDEYRVVM